MTVNERMAQIRKAQSLTMQAFGEKLGVGKTAISKIESGERNPSDQLLRSVCREFRAREDWLRCGEGAMYEPMPDELFLDELAERHGLGERERRALSVFIRLPEDARVAIMQYVDALVEEFGQKPDEDSSTTTIEELAARVDALEKGADSGSDAGSA